MAVLLSFELNRTFESKLPYTLGNRILTSASSCLIQQKLKPSPLALPHKVYKAIYLNEKRLFRSNRYQRPQKAQAFSSQSLEPHPLSYAAIDTLILVTADGKPSILAVLDAKSPIPHFE